MNKKDYAGLGASHDLDMSGTYRTGTIKPDEFKYTAKKLNTETGLRLSRWGKLCVFIRSCFGKGSVK